MSNITTPLFQAPSHYRVLDDWREAEALVRKTWQAFVGAEASKRRSAFASYVAALNAEEAAAAALSLSDIAA